MNKKFLSQNDFYSSSDLCLSTTINLFYPIEAIDRNNPDRICFLFKRDESLDKFLEKYWKRELRIEPQVYFQQLKIIKSRIYEK